MVHWTSILLGGTTYPLLTAKDDSERLDLEVSDRFKFARGDAKAGSG